jgi:hypothetical protein
MDACGGCLINTIKCRGQRRRFLAPRVSQRLTLYISVTGPRAMRWFRKPTADSPRLLSLSPLRCGGDASDVTEGPTIYRQPSACADLSSHQRQHRSRIGESQGHRAEGKRSAMRLTAAARPIHLRSKQPCSLKYISVLPSHLLLGRSSGRLPKVIPTNIVSRYISCEI